MKQVILSSIELSNYKGQNRKLDFGTSVNKITGKNKSGKSTIVKAFNWLLTGRSDAQTLMNSDLFDNRLEMDENTPITSVTAHLLIDDKEFVLSRTAKAKFKKNRASGLYEKATSDEYKYYVDDIELNATDYNDWISANICDSKLLPYALGGQFFLSIAMDDKKKARVIISNLIGEIKPKDVDGDFPYVVENIGSFTLEQLSQQLSNQSSSLKSQMDENETKISIKQEDKSNIEQIDFALIERKITEQKEKLADVNGVIANKTAVPKELLDEINNAKNSRKAIEEVIEKSKFEYRKQMDAKTNELELRIAKIEEKNRQVDSINISKQNEINVAIQTKENYQKTLSSYNEKAQRLREEYKEIQSRTFDSSELKCKYCGQPLPQDKIDELKSKFDKEQKSDFDNCVQRGKANASNIKVLEEQIAELDSTIKKGFIPEAKEDVSTYKDSLADMKSKIIPYEETEQYKEYKKQLDAIIVPQIQSVDVSDLEHQREEIQNEIDSLNQTLGKKSMLNDIEKQIESLLNIKKKLGIEWASIESKKQEISDFKQAKMKILTEKVNCKLEYSKIDIWSKQKNGDEIPDLVIKDKDGVNYETTNGASRLTIATDLQHLFCQYLGVNMPYFVDESSIMNEENLPKYDESQMFYLYCTDEETLQVSSL